MIRWLLCILIAVGVMSCGHSEDEWKAQLAKYDALSKKNTAQEAELTKERQRVADLSQQLENMGMKVKDFDQTRTALDEYKKRAETLERIKARFETLRKKLQKLTNLGLNVAIRKNRMVVSLPGDVLFPSAKDTLREDGINILAKVAEVIRSDASLAGRQYQVAGHTDNKPLNPGSPFKDNWGLSVMRARQVLVFLTSPAEAKGGGGALPSTLWSASGYGETDPIADNNAEEGRQKNRRVEIILMPDVEEMLDLKSFI